jgi:hypothetical protein
MLSRTLFVLVSCLGVVASTPLVAQTDSIGVTSVGNPVYIERKSITRAEGLITAAVRAKFLKPVKAPGGDLKASRTIAIFDCAKRVIAVKENWFYWDERGTREANHKKVGKPGFSSPFKGSLPDVALQYLCTTAPK